MWGFHGLSSGRNECVSMRSHVFYMFSRAWVAPGILLPVLIGRLRLCLFDVLREYCMCRFIVAAMDVHVGFFLPLAPVL